LRRQKIPIECHLQKSTKNSKCRRRFSLEPHKGIRPAKRRMGTGTGESAGVPDPAQDHDPAGAEASPPIVGGVLILLMEEAPDVFASEVLQRLTAADRAVLGRVNRASRSSLGPGWCAGPLVVGGFCDAISRLAWAIDNGCPWNERTLCTVARGGELEVLRWAAGPRAHSHACGSSGAPLPGLSLTAKVCADAASMGHMHVVKWLREQDPPCPWGANVCAAAAGGGQLRMLQWLREHECPWDVTTLLPAAQRGHVDVLQWGWEQDCPIALRLAVTAAREGRLDVLQWAWEHDCIWEEDVVDLCNAAARNGHLHVLKWCRGHGCQWGLMTCAWRGGARSEPDPS